MAISIVLSILSLMVAAVAFWTVYETSTRQRVRRRELENEHAIEIARLQNGYNDEVGKLRQQLRIIDSEVQAFRQEFRKATRLNRMEIDKLNHFCENLAPGWNAPKKPDEKPRMS